MTERTLKLLVGGLAISVVAWLAAALFSGGAGTISASGEITHFLDGLEADVVDAVHIEGPDGPIALLRNGDSWTANGFPADPEAVELLLAILPDLRVGDVIATNPDNHERMGVSEGVAVKVTFDLNGAPRSLLLGRRGRGFGTAYVRTPADDAVYLLHGDLLGQVIRRVDDWRDRVMVRTDTADVVRIAVERDGDAYTLLRGDSAWSFEGGDAASPTVIVGILSELSNLVASGFLPEGDSIAALERGGGTIAYSAEGAVLADISVGTGQADRWGRTAANDYIYRLTSFRVGRISPTRESARPAR
ncbi:MAG: DUF4340 domain-containing protein [Gemmatimonadetes bacterium]|nr:DUF4340 domain-containing protein [Gemmatimonadota bacterium]MDA1103436.1 DUF4340 domain-containing protein [Gemmatimonadota bacterium]